MYITKAPNGKHCATTNEKYLNERYNTEKKRKNLMIWQKINPVLSKSGDFFFRIRDGKVTVKDGIKPPMTVTNIVMMGKRDISEIRQAISSGKCEWLGGRKPMWYRLLEMYGEEKITISRNNLKSGTKVAFRDNRKRLVEGYVTSIHRESKDHPSYDLYFIQRGVRGGISFVRAYNILRIISTKK